MREVYIPPATAEKLNGSHYPGERHAAIVDIAMSLVGNGMSAEDIFREIRANFDSEKSDKEIRDVIEWCQNRNPTPSGYGLRTRANGHYKPLQQKPVKITPESAQKAANRLLEGFSKGEAEWLDDSPIKIGEFEDDARLLFSHLYAPGEFINIVKQFGEDSTGRIYPVGGGKILTREKWIEYVAKNGTPCDQAGAWIRPNPCKAVCTGKDGAPTDHDVTRFAYVLLESDWLPKEVQLSVFAKLKLPISALIDSGGKSVHAWLKIDAANEEDFRSKAEAIYSVFIPLGFDKLNKNPSRLSRLPGATRTLKVNGRQRLIYLNPNPTWDGQEALDIAAEPLMEGLILGKDLIERVEEYMKPKPPPFTLPIFEVGVNEGFYFRPSEVTIWSGLTGHGKSTMLSTVQLHLLAAHIPFFVASFEYLPEKLCEMLASIFYNGNATSQEVVKFLKVTGDCFSVLDFTGSIEPDTLLRYMRNAFRKFGVQHFFIDSLMRVGRLEEDYPAQTDFVNQLQGIAKETNGHIHLVAHPRKIDENFRAKKMDVKGNSSLVNNADNIVTMRRNVEKDNLSKQGDLTPDKDREMHDAEFCVEKQRASGWEGVIRLTFDKRKRVFAKFKPPEKKWLEHPRSNMRGKY